MKLRVLLYCLLGGLPLSIAALGAGGFTWWWLSGILVAAGFVPFALFGPRGGLRQLGLWLWVIQIGRGALMTLAVLPAIHTLRLPRAPAAIAVGALLWIAGGAAPLLPPNDVMVTAQRVIHIVEILTQNASLGITAVLLLRPRRLL